MCIHSCVQHIIKTHNELNCDFSSVNSRENALISGEHFWLLTGITKKNFEQHMLIIYNIIWQSVQSSLKLNFIHPARMFIGLKLCCRKKYNPLIFVRQQVKLQVTLKDKTSIHI